jgi:hypothetical protein
MYEDIKDDINSQIKNTITSNNTNKFVKLTTVGSESIA